MFRSKNKDHFVSTALWVDKDSAKNIQNGHPKNSKWPPNCLKMFFRGEKDSDKKNKEHFVSTALWVDKDSANKIKMAQREIQNGCQIV